jgi:hypothetical protein
MGDLVVRVYSQQTLTNLGILYASSASLVMLKG